MYTYTYMYIHIYTQNSDFLSFFGTNSLITVNKDFKQCLCTVFCNSD